MDNLIKKLAHAILLTAPPLISLAAEPKGDDERSSTSRLYVDHEAKGDVNSVGIITHKKPSSAPNLLNVARTEKENEFLSQFKPCLGKNFPESWRYSVRIDTGKSRPGLCLVPRFPEDLSDKELPVDVLSEQQPQFALQSFQMYINGSELEKDKWAKEILTIDDFNDDSFPDLFFLSNMGACGSYSWFTIVYYDPKLKLFREVATEFPHAFYDNKAKEFTSTACGSCMCEDPVTENVKAKDLSFFDPSFDCGPANTRVEREICIYKDLAQDDAKLSKAFHELRKHLTKPEKEALRASQKAWIESRNECETTDNIFSCLSLRYYDRNRYIGQCAEAKKCPPIPK